MRACSGATFLVLLILMLAETVKGATTSRPDPPGEITEIKVTIGLLDVDGIDGAQQSFEANVIYSARWDDPRLKHDGRDVITRSLSEVWHPRLQIVNQQKTWSTIDALVDISPDGNVVLMQRVWGSFSQPLELKEFPFDTQKFEIQLAAAGYEGDEVNLIPDDALNSGMAERFSLPDWKVTGSSSGPRPFRPTSTEALTTPSFVYQFTAERHNGYYILKIIVPLILIVAMSWIVFWIDPCEAGTQIGVSTTAMLTLIAFRFTIDGLVPKVSYLTRMDLFILGSTGIVFATLVQAVITTILAKSERYPIARRLDVACRLIFPAVFGLLLYLSFLAPI